MKKQEIDRIECAIRHIESSLDVDPWAREIAVKAMEKQIPKEPDMVQSRLNKNLWYLYCPSCKNQIGVYNSRSEWDDMRNISNGIICPYCGQAIALEGDNYDRD